MNSKNLAIRSTKIIDLDGNSVRSVNENEDYTISILIEAFAPVKSVSVGYNIKIREGTVVYGTSTALSNHFSDFEAGQISEFKFSFKSTLALGTYYLSAGAAETLTPEDEIHNYVMQDFVHDALAFVAVSNTDKGLVNMNSKLLSFKIID